jgi:hypothetical protein
MQPLDVFAEFRHLLFDELADFRRLECLPLFAREGAYESGMSLCRGWGKGHGVCGELCRVSVEDRVAHAPAKSRDIHERHSVKGAVIRQKFERSRSGGTELQTLMEEP